MKISVILPCFNGAKTIESQLKALASQEWEGDWEVIISNNGSTDNSMEIVERFRNQLPALKIVDAHDPSGPRLGAWHSYNVGMRAAKGDAFVFCESDDEVGVGWLAAMAEALKEHEFVVAKMEYHKLNPEWILPQTREMEQESGLCNAHNPPYEYAFGCTFGFTRGLYDQLGDLNTNLPFAFDAEYCWRAQKQGIKIQFASKAIIHYRLRNTAKSRYIQGKNWGEDFILATRFYDRKISLLTVLNAYITVVKYVIKGPLLLFLYQFNRSEVEQEFSDWIWGLGWLQGRIIGMQRVLPGNENQ